MLTKCLLCARHCCTGTPTTLPGEGAIVSLILQVRKLSCTHSKWSLRLFDCPCWEAFLVSHWWPGKFPLCFHPQMQWHSDPPSSPSRPWPWLRSRADGSLLPTGKQSCSVLNFSCWLSFLRSILVSDVSWFLLFLPSPSTNDPWFAGFLCPVPFPESLSTCPQGLSVLSVIAAPSESLFTSFSAYWSDLFCKTESSG